MAQRRVLGIDLGTTYSCVAYVNDYGKPEVLMNQRNEQTTPSVVWFDGDRVSVGQEAKEMSAVYPESVCSFIKRQMGKEDYTFDIGGIQYSPEHISSLILRKLVQDASTRLGEPVTDVVITCPAYFFVKEREATKRAGEMAGLNVLQIVNEPTAAAVDYGIQSAENDPRTILVYDLGGGTFDVTVMRVSPNGLDVVCTDGDHQLGGKDWDDTLTRYFAERIGDETGLEVDLANDAELYYDLMQQAEEAKRHLSSKNSVGIRLSHNGEKVRFDLTREEFESMTRDLLERTILLTRQCLDTTQDKMVETPCQVILVGGSSKMPKVAARLMEEFGIEPEIFDPDEAVAKGAAIIGNNILLKEKVVKKLSAGKSRALLVEDASDFEREAATQMVAEEMGISAATIQQAIRSIRNVSSKTFGAIAIEPIFSSYPDAPFRYVSNIIFRNTPLPCENTVTFSTVIDGQQTVLVELMENLSVPSPTCELIENKILDALLSHDQDLYLQLLNDHYWELNRTPEEDSVLLWSGELFLPPGLRADSPIDLTYKLDENGLLTLIATEPTSGKQLVKTIQTGVSQESKEFEAASQKSRSLMID